MPALVAAFGFDQILRASNVPAPGDTRQGLACATLGIGARKNATRKCLAPPAATIGS